jgi:hypothetical protein
VAELFIFEEHVGRDMAETVRAVRHGQRRDSVDPDWEDHADRVHDPPLTDLGRWAAWRVARRFVESGTSVDAVYASPFLRVDGGCRRPALWPDATRPDRRRVGNWRSPGTPRI